VTAYPLQSRVAATLHTVLHFITRTSFTARPLDCASSLVLQLYGPITHKVLLPIRDPDAAPFLL